MSTISASESQATEPTTEAKARAAARQANEGRTAGTSIWVAHRIPDQSVTSPKCWVVTAQPPYAPTEEV